MNTFQSFSPTVWLYIFGTLRVFSNVLSLNGVFDAFDTSPLFYISFKQSKNDVIRMKPNGLRIFLIFYAFAFYIITTGYKGTLVSCLAIPVVPTPMGELSNPLPHRVYMSIKHNFRYI